MLPFPLASFPRKSSRGRAWTSRSSSADLLACRFAFASRLALAQTKTHGCTRITTTNLDHTSSTTQTTARAQFLGAEGGLSRPHAENADVLPDAAAAPPTPFPAYRSTPSLQLLLKLQRLCPVPVELAAASLPVIMRLVVQAASAPSPSSPQPVCRRGHHRDHNGSH